MSPGATERDIERTVRRERITGIVMAIVLVLMVAWWSAKVHRALSHGATGAKKTITRPAVVR